MNYEHITLYLTISVLAGLSILSLRLRTSPSLSDGAVPFAPSAATVWFVLLGLMLGLCFLVSADFLLAAFYVIFVFMALFVVFTKFNAAILRPNIDYGQASKKGGKFLPRSWISVAASALRVLNILVVSPILAGLTGAAFHAAVTAKEVDLIVYTAFVASLSFAGFITYFASVKQSGRASIMAMVYGLLCLAVISFSGKVMLA